VGTDVGVEEIQKLGHQHTEYSERRSLYFEKCGFIGTYIKHIEDGAKHKKELESIAEEKSKLPKTCPTCGGPIDV
jgi:hypothetical protein